MTGRYFDCNLDVYAQVSGPTEVTDHLALDEGKRSIVATKRSAAGLAFSTNRAVAVRTKTVVESTVLE